MTEPLSGQDLRELTIALLAPPLACFFIASVYLVALFPSQGLYAFGSFLDIPKTDLSFHTYSLIIYSIVLTVFVSRWSWKGYFVGAMLWAVNELTFNVLYSLYYPYDTNVFHYVDNDLYLATATTLAILAYFIVRPKLKINSLTFVFPAFLIVWACFGLPLMVPNRGPADIGLPLNLNNFWWELAYQITLIVSFCSTVHKRESTLQKQTAQTALNASVEGSKASRGTEASA